MARRQPEELTQEEAFALIFPTMSPCPGGVPPPDPPASWKPPRTQHHEAQADPGTIPILDEIVREVVEKKRVTYNRCPYFEARFWIVLGVRVAKKTSLQEDAIRQETADKSKREALALRLHQAAALLKGILENENPKFDAIGNAIPKDERGFSRPDYDAQNLAHAHFLKLTNVIHLTAPPLVEALGGLAHLMDRAEQQRIPIMAVNAASPWQTGFVEALGHGWVSLYGNQPAKNENSEFIAFAQAAYVALGGTKRNLTAAKIRTIVARVRGGSGQTGRKADNQFDRLARPEQELKAQMETQLIRALHAARSGDKQAAVALEYAYETAEADERAFLENLGYHPSSASSTKPKPE